MTEPEYTGKDVSYYLVDIKTPKRLDPYKAECEDIIEALGMTFAEGCAFKAIWRKCAARTLGVAKAGYKGGLYDAEKTHYYGGRMVAAEERLLLPQHAPTPHYCGYCAVPEGAMHHAQCPLVAPMTFKERCAEIDAEIQAAALAEPVDIYAQAAAHIAEASPQPRVVGMNPNLAAPFNAIPHVEAEVEQTSVEVPAVCPGCGREEGKKCRRGCPTLAVQPEVVADPFTDAPEWAKYKAQDEDGDWYWYENRPKKTDCLWMTEDGLYNRELRTQIINPNWRDTLIEHPIK